MYNIEITSHERVGGGKRDREAERRRGERENEWEYVAVQDAGKSHTLLVAMWIAVTLLESDLAMYIKI